MLFIGDCVCDMPGNAVLALQGQLGDALLGNDRYDIGIDAEARTGDLQVIGNDISMFFFFSLAVEFSIRSRVSIEKPQTNSFSGLCAPTHARMSSVRSRAMLISPSCFFTLSAATVAGR